MSIYLLFTFFGCRAVALTRCGAFGFAGWLCAASTAAHCSANHYLSITFFMKIWGIHKKYVGLSWWENFMGGHISFLGITVFGANAMRWSVNISTKRWGYICFTLPVLARFITRRDGSKWWEWYFYLSPNGTPWASTFYRGSNENEKIRAQIRKLNFGHGFNTDKFRNELYALNQKFEWFRLNEYDVERFGDKGE